MAYWMSAKPTADAFWSLDDQTPFTSKGDWCLQQHDGLQRFGSCLNTGVFIVRNTPWANGWLQRTLDLSNRTIKEHCSTASLNPFFFNKCLSSLLVFLETNSFSTQWRQRERRS